MKSLLALFFTAMGVLSTLVVQAQSETNDTGLMRSNGKIFVVMAVTLIILVGMVLFLVQLDRKISRLEKGGE